MRHEPISLDEGAEHLARELGVVVHRQHVGRGEGVPRCRGDASQWVLSLEEVEGDC